MDKKNVLLPHCNPSLSTHTLKSVSLLLLGIFLATLPLEAKKVKVTVQVPGTLPTLISAKHKNKITSLTLKGSLNGTDLLYLREMAGSDHNQQRTEGQLRKIDLSEVTFAPGGKSYINKDFEQYPTGPYTIPKFLFRNCLIEEVILPLRTDSIDVGAFEHTHLKKIQLPEDIVIGAWAFNENPELEEVIFPQRVWEIGSYCFKDCKKLKQIILQDVYYLGYFSFFKLPALETFEVKGFVEYVSNNFVDNCPELNRIEFRGPVLTSGYPSIVSNCPSLEHIYFEDFVINVQMNSARNCPLLKEYTFKGIVMYGNQDLNLSESQTKSTENPKYWESFEKLDKYYTHIPPRKFRSRSVITKLLFEGVLAYAAQEEQAKSLRLLEIMANLGYQEYEFINTHKKLDGIRNEVRYPLILEQIRQNGDFILKLQNAAPYSGPERIHPNFSYAEATDSNFVRIRSYFNLDSIAGQGDEISKIKNLLYWLHDSIRHDGSSTWPDCNFNVIELYELAKKENRGYNCRFLAMMLNEIYLAMGFKSRFLTCQSQEYDTDGDCHVINVVWSTTLQKWVWMDPSFAAYVTDENGLLLHPGEVRERLIKGLPLAVNKEANWNHSSEVTTEWYLENYMAKNLYLISSHLVSEYESEGRGRNSSPEINLVPNGFTYNWGAITTDDSYFWQAPE